MVKQVRELWRMVRAGGQLAITTWGPRMFEPGSAAWWAAVKQFRPDLHAAFNPWERIITPQAVRQLLQRAELKMLTSSQRTVSRPSISGGLVDGSAWIGISLDARTDGPRNRSAS